MHQQASKREIKSNHQSEAYKFIVTPKYKLNTITEIFQAFLFKTLAFQQNILRASLPKVIH